MKIDGKRAYAIARHSDEMPELKSRKIFIKSIHCLESDESAARFEVHCGKGAYIRSLARDMGLRLGTVAHVTELRRLSVGQFSTKNAISLDFLKELGHSAAASPYVIPVVAALDDIPALMITTAEAQKLRYGQLLQPKPDLAPDTIYKALVDGELVALIEVREDGLKPMRVFNC